MLVAAEAADPYETGGVLLGPLSRGSSWITHAVEVPARSPARQHYILPRGVTHHIVRCARGLDSRLGYLGEWHTHPADAGPSLKDAVTMVRLRLLNASVPPMLLIRKEVGGYQVHAFRFQSARPVACPIIRTGDLPPNPSTPGSE